MTFVIVGAGLAGAKAAETLRQEGFDGRIVLIGDEPEPPYERPPLSKGRLLGAAERDSVYVHTPDWYAEQAIELRTGTAVTGLDIAARQVTLAGGERLEYDKLLLATGAAPRPLDIAGAQLDGVHYLRTLADSDRLAAVLTPGSQVVIIGAGWIGLELAAAARHHQAAVTVVETAALPLQKVLGDEVAEVFAALHRENGVDFRFGAHAAEFRGDARVCAVLLADGTELPADVVVVAIGVTPKVELARQAGLRVDNGIVADESLRTGDPHVFTAGDVASGYHPLLGKHIRTEHWAHALNSGPAAARAMLGQNVSYDELPYFFTDQYDLGMEYSGHVTPGGYDRVVFRGSVQDRRFLAFWTRGAAVVAGMNVNVWDVHDDIRALVGAGLAGKAADLEKLSNPDVPLRETLL